MTKDELQADLQLLLEAAQEVSAYSEHRTDSTYSIPQQRLDNLRLVIKNVTSRSSK